MVKILYFNISQTCILCKFLACDCDPTGSLYDGDCENRNDEELDLVAGRCICKTHVTGRRCDQCKEGYWNLREDSADGCEGTYMSVLWNSLVHQGTFVSG